MLLIDGVKYEEWTPQSEEEFETVVERHAEEIFGKDAKYFDLKHKLASRSGTGSIPDGYVITLGNKPEVQIIELELASHSLQHIVSQMVNIINGIENATTQQKICNAIEDGINEDDIFAARIAKAIKPVAIHRFLSDNFSNTLPIINIIIDKSSPALEEAISKITPPTRIIEFQTFVREGAGLAVHAHLFEPLYEPTMEEVRNLPDGSREWVLDGVVWVREGTYTERREASDVAAELQADGYKTEVAWVSKKWRSDPYWKDAKNYVVYHTKEKVAKELKGLPSSSPPPTKKVELIAWPGARGRLNIPKESMNFFPVYGEPFTIVTEIGEFKIRLYKQKDEKDHFHLKEWFGVHPEVRKGEKIRVTVIEPLKRYGLEIVK